MAAWHGVFLHLMPEFTPFSAWLPVFPPPMPEFTPFSAWLGVFALRDRRLSGWSGAQTAESLPSRQKTAYAAELGLLVASRLTASDSPRIGTGGFLPFRLPSGAPDLLPGCARASLPPACLRPGLHTCLRSAPALRHRLSTVNHPGPPGSRQYKTTRKCTD